MQMDEKGRERLWSDYSRTKSSELREKLILEYAPLVKIVAGRLSMYLGYNVEYDDLVSYGIFGLIDAIDKYDLNKQNKFETYAGVRIRGAMIDYLRSKDWLPISMRQKIRSYENCVSQLEGTLGRSATDEEIAEAMGVSIDEFTKVVTQLNVATIIPLDEYMRAETAMNAVPSPQETIEKQERQETLAKAIERLPERERHVVSLYYHEELTMKEISLVLGISEARVCQLHTKAIFRLRGYLAREKANLVG